MSGRKDLYFVPQVLKQSAALYDAEADAAGQDKLLSFGSEVYTIKRRAFLDAVKLDAYFLKANAVTLRCDDEEKEERMKKLRVEKCVRFRTRHCLDTDVSPPEDSTTSSPPWDLGLQSTSRFFRFTHSSSHPSRVLMFFARTASQTSARPRAGAWPASRKTMTRI